MILKNSLYTITRKDLCEAGVSYHIALNASCFIYQAHFPGEPITPGVCIVQIANELMADHLGAALSVKTIKNVKFLSVITPTEDAAVTYTIAKMAETRDTVKAQITVEANGTVKAKISMICSKDAQH